MKSRLSTILKKGVLETFQSDSVQDSTKWCFAMDSYRESHYFDLTVAIVENKINEAVACLDSIRCTALE